MRSYFRLRAFTLIELLVVISIIAVLASMLLPAIGTVRRSAQTAMCASGLRQIAMAGFSYAADAEGMLPMDDTGLPGQVWMLFLSSYLDAAPDNATTTTQIYDNSVYWCCKAPATGGSGKIFESLIGAPPTNSIWKAYGVSGIGMNLYPAYAPGNSGLSLYQNTYRLSAVTYKTSRGFFGDSLYHPMLAGGPGPYNCTVAFYPDWIALGWKYAYTDPERHGGRMNMAFYDGHTQTVPAATAYLALTDPASFK